VSFIFEVYFFDRETNRADTFFEGQVRFPGLITVRPQFFGLYRHGLDQADALLVQVSMQIKGLGLDVVTHQKIHTQDWQIRLAHRPIHTGERFLGKTRLVIPDFNVKPG
jgi:hypothetical protein